MSAIRPDLPARPFGAVAPQGGASQAGRASAFFRAALNPGSGEAAPVEAQSEPQRDTPVRAVQTPSLEQRLQRPGSLLNILV